MDAKDTFSLKRTYKAPVHLVWQVITQKEHLKQWYFDFAENWNLKIGSEFEWLAGPPDGKQWLHKGKMLEVVENKKLSHSWEYPGYSGTSIVTWELHRIDDHSTELTFTHYFKVPFDAQEEALRRENFVEGWNHILNIGLVEYLDKIGK